MSDLINVLAVELAKVRRDHATAVEALRRAAPEFIRRAHAALYHAVDASSMVAMHLIDDAQEHLDDAAIGLVDDLAQRARALAQECRETMRGALGYVVTLEQEASELLAAVDAFGEAA